MDAAIRTEELTKRYGGRLALNGLNLTVERGEVFGFLGPNGAGKTTTIRLLLDLIRPTAGRAAILGFDCQRQSHLARAKTGYLPGDLRLYHRYTGRDMLSLVTGLRAERADPAFIDHLAGLLEIDLDERIGSLSKGNRQKIGLLIPLVSRPELLLLDEPTSGLDPIMQEVVWELLRQEAERGVTVFFSSHVMSEVEQICQRVAILRAGTLVAVEPIAELKGRGVRRIEITLGIPLPEQAFRLPGVREISRQQSTIVLEVAEAVDAVVKEAARYPVIDIRTEQPGLEETLLTYYREVAS